MTFTKVKWGQKLKRKSKKWERTLTVKLKKWKKSYKFYKIKSLHLTNRLVQRKIKDSKANRPCRKSSSKMSTCKESWQNIRTTSCQKRFQFRITLNSNNTLKSVASSSNGSNKSITFVNPMAIFSNKWSNLRRLW